MFEVLLQVCMLLIGISQKKKKRIKMDKKQYLEIRAENFPKLKPKNIQELLKISRNIINLNKMAIKRKKD